MADLFSGLPDLILEEIAKYLVPPGTTAWKKLQVKVFPLRYLTRRFTHHLTSILLKSVTVELISTNLSQAKIFLAFRSQVSQCFPTRHLEIFRYPDLGTVLLENGQWGRSKDLDKLYHDVVVSCCEGLQELSLILRNGTGNGPDSELHGSRSEVWQYSLPRIQKITIRSDYAYGRLFWLSTCYPKLSSLHLEPACWLKYKARIGTPINFRWWGRREIQIQVDVLSTSDILWLANEAAASGQSFRPLQLVLRLDLLWGHENPVQSVIEGAEMLRETGFYERLGRITIQTMDKVERVEKDQIEAAFQKASGDKADAVTIEWT